MERQRLRNRMDDLDFLFRPQTPTGNVTKGARSESSLDRVDGRDLMISARRATGRRAIGVWLPAGRLAQLPAAESVHPVAGGIEWLPANRRLFPNSSCCVS